MKKNLAARIASLLLWRMALFFAPLQAKAAEKGEGRRDRLSRTFWQMHADGSVSGYAYEYLTQIQKYTDGNMNGWK